MDNPVRFKVRITTTKDWGFMDWVPEVGTVVEADDSSTDIDTTKIFFINHRGSEMYKFVYKWRLELAEDDGGDAWTTP